MPLFTHARPPCGFPVRYHSPSLSLLHNPVRFVRGRFLFSKGSVRFIRTGTRSDGHGAGGFEGGQKVRAIPRRETAVERREWVSEQRIGSGKSREHGCCKLKRGGRKEGEREETQLRGLIFKGVLEGYSSAINDIYEGHFGKRTYRLGKPYAYMAWLLSQAALWW